MKIVTFVDALANPSIYIRSSRLVLRTCRYVGPQSSSCVNVYMHLLALVSSRSASISEETKMEFNSKEACGRGALCCIVVSQ